MNYKGNSRYLCIIFQKDLISWEAMSPFCDRMTKAGDMLDTMVMLEVRDFDMLQQK